MSNALTPTFTLHYCADHLFLFGAIGGPQKKWYCPIDGNLMTYKQISENEYQGWKKGADNHAKLMGFEDVDAVQSYMLTHETRFDMLTGNPIKSIKNPEIR